MATTLLKTYTLTLFDAIGRWHPRVELHVYVDDVDLFTTSPNARTAADALSQAADFLLDAVERALRLEVAFHKCVLLVSSASTGGHLQRAMQRRPALPA